MSHPTPVKHRPAAAGQRRADPPRAAHLPRDRVRLTANGVERDDDGKIADMHGTAPAPQASPPGAAGADTPGEAATAAPGSVVHDEERATRPAMLRGFRRRCPHCGQGHLFEGYLKVTDRCPVCREELFHHRADDGPAYLTILVVGHLMAPLIHIAFTTFRPEPLVMATVFTVGCVALSLYLLPRLKGVVVGIQWARRMHGFRLAA